MPAFVGDHHDRLLICGRRTHDDVAGAHADDRAVRTACDALLALTLRPRSRHPQPIVATLCVGKSLPTRLVSHETPVRTFVWNTCSATRE